MALSIFLQYQNKTLAELAGKLRTDYYDLVGILVGHVDDHCNYLASKQISKDSAVYRALCGELITDIKKCLAYRVDELIPYLNELAKKEETGHNCSSCTGRCDMQHSARLLEYMASLEETKATFHKIRAVVSEEYATGDSELNILRNEMVNLDNALNELFLIEELSLLPKMKAAQKNINVVS